MPTLMPIRPALVDTWVAMTAVVARADPGRSTLYGHFRTKDELPAAAMAWPCWRSSNT